MPSFRGWRRLPAAIALLLLASCGSSPSPTPDPASAVARINDTVVTRHQLDIRVQSALTALAGAGGSTSNAAMVGRVRGNVVRGLIFDTVIAQEAAVRNVAATDKDVDSQLKQATSDAGGQAQLQTQLAAAGQSIETLRDEIRARLNEQRLEDFFARDRAAGVIQLLTGGQDFVQLVTQYSDSPDTKTKAGNLGTLGDDQVRAQLGDSVLTAIAPLHAGQITPVPVRSTSGYEVIRVEAVGASGRALREILVAAPDPYTVRERPNWFSEQVFLAILDDCQKGRISVYINDPGANPCTATGPPAASPSATPRP